MKHTFLSLLSTLLIAACIHPNQQPDTSAAPADSNIATAKSDSLSEEPEHLEEVLTYPDSAMAARLYWVSDVVPIALKSSTNPLIRHELKDSSITWMWDKLVFSDTAAYVSLHVGHEENDKKGFKRFITAGWLYVDTLSRNVYEYSVARDSLIKL
jgi:hypothetical protein